MTSGADSGLPVASQRTLFAQEEGCEAARGTVCSHGSEPGMEPRLHSGSVARWQAVPVPDDGRCQYARKACHRSRPEPEGRRCGTNIEPVKVATWSTEDAFL